MEVAFKSDNGKKRKTNEDNVGIDSEKSIFILADGMGGHQAGEVASEVAVIESISYLKDKIDNAENEGERGLSKILAEALFKAHDAVREKARTDFNYTGMGTTLVEMIIRNNTAFICHAGDSWAYILQDDIRQVTRDHTVGDYLVAHNIMSREQVPPQKWHTLTQAVGASGNLTPELNQVELKEGDYLLLCSDGLSDMLMDDEIFEIVKRNNKEVGKAIDDLIEEANKKGGKDNISVILVSYYSGHNNGNVLFHDSLPTSDRILLGKSAIPKSFLEVPLICVPYDKNVT